MPLKFDLMVRNMLRHLTTYLKIFYLMILENLTLKQHDNTVSLMVPRCSLLSPLYQHISTIYSTISDSSRKLHYIYIEIFYV